MFKVSLHAHPFFQFNFRIVFFFRLYVTYIMLRRITCLKKPCLHQPTARFSSRASNWFTRFLTPKEEKQLYLGITSSFREKLIEQGNKSTQHYSNIIEHAIFARPTTTTTSLLEQFTKAIDAAGKDVTKLQQIEKEMYLEHIKTATLYNRLIRSYIASDALSLAESLVEKLDSRGIFATTRTFTYLIQAYLKQGDLDKAKVAVGQMKDLNLLRLRHGFDCSVMLKFYEACGDSHAIEFLWRDVMLHANTIRPGLGLYTQYLEHLLAHQHPLKALVKEYLGRQDKSSFNQHQYTIWMNAVKRLLSTDDLQEAEHLLLHLIKSAPSKLVVSDQNVKKCIQSILSHYLKHGQDLKSLALYYRARKMGAPDQMFEPHILQQIEGILEKVEQDTCNEDHRAMLEEFARPLKL